jgi:hypothetical protein
MNSHGQIIGFARTQAWGRSARAWKSFSSGVVMVFGCFGLGWVGKVAVDPRPKRRFAAGYFADGPGGAALRARECFPPGRSRVGETGFLGGCDEIPRPEKARMHPGQLCLSGVLVGMQSRNEKTLPTLFFRHYPPPAKKRVHASASGVGATSAISCVVGVGPLLPLRLQ